MLEDETPCPYKKIDKTLSAVICNQNGHVMCPAMFSYENTGINDNKCVQVVLSLFTHLLATVLQLAGPIEDSLNLLCSKRKGLVSLFCIHVPLGQPCVMERYV